MAQKINKTIGMGQEAWDALRELASEDIRPQNSELEFLILAERDRRRAAAAADQQ